MSDTMIIKLAELTRVIYAVAYVSLETGRVSVWDNGSRLFTITPDGRIEGDERVKAEDVLRSSGWSLCSDWTRPSEEWQEFRADVLGTQPVTDVPAGWATIEA